MCSCGSIKTERIDVRAPVIFKYWFSGRVCFSQQFYVDLKLHIVESRYLRDKYLQTVDYVLDVLVMEPQAWQASGAKHTNTK